MIYNIAKHKKYTEYYILSEDKNFSFRPKSKWYMHEEHYGFNTIEKLSSVKEWKLEPVKMPASRLEELDVLFQVRALDAIPRLFPEYFV